MKQTDLNTLNLKSPVLLARLSLAARAGEISNFDLEKGLLDLVEYLGVLDKNQS
jgi:hypothetical protein